MRVALALTVAVLATACKPSVWTPTPVAVDWGPPEAGAPDASPASLLSLVVSPLALTPPFSPDTHDYYVRCAAGTNPLTVTMTAARDGTVAVQAPATSSPARSTSMSLRVAEDEAIVVSATLGGATTEYWVRCLPHTFPRLATTKYDYVGSVVSGYYLVGNTFYARGELGYAMVLDTNGTPVWYGVTSDGAGAKDVQLLGAGTISYVPIGGYTFGSYAGHYELHGLDPVSVDFVTSIGVPVDTHELRELPNGDFLLIAAPVVTGLDLTGLEKYGADEDALNCVIQEVTPRGDLVWQWSATDHIDPVRETTWPQHAAATTLAGKSVVVADLFHCNSLDVDRSGNILVSARQMDALFLISRQTGKIAWKMGGAPYSKDGAALIHVIGDPMNGFYRQHDARFLPDATISLFDDQTAKAGPARALVLAYDVSAGTASILWQYRGRGSVGSMGSFTILPDGSRVIGWGTAGFDMPTLTEADLYGEDLLDFSFSDGDTSYRAVKVPTSAMDLETLRTAVGPRNSVVADAGNGLDARP